MFVGINSYFEHPSVAIIDDGKLLYAAEDERFTGLKGGKSYNPFHAYFPLTALYRGLKEIGKSCRDIKAFGFSYSPLLHLASLYGCFTGSRLSSFGEELAAFFSTYKVQRLLGTEYGYRPEFRSVLDRTVLRKIPFYYLDHHLTHAASAFFLSGFEDAVIVTADGAGERAAARISLGKGANIKTLKNYNLPNSLGHLYSFVTDHLGFKPFSDEYKVMGLAAYGKDEYQDAFRDLLRLGPAGEFKVDLKKASRLSTILGPARVTGEGIEERHAHIAHSLQKRTEDAIVHIVEHAKKLTNARYACFAGGVFMNSVANGKILGGGIFDKVFFMPAASDAGTAVGAAALLHARNTPRAAQVSFPGMFLGTNYTNESIKKVCKDFQTISVEELNEDALAGEVANLLAQGEIGATFRGRMEFGDRALGNRSILADPGIQDVVELLNTVKGREMFRPVAPLTSASSFNDYFIGHGNEHMMATCQVREDARARIKGCVHADGSARVQIIPAHGDPFLLTLLEKFKALRGYPVLINTSFNLNGQPMIESPRQALVALHASRLRFLVMNNILVRKTAA